MPLGAEETALVVRATARVSAAVFAASLVFAARRLAAGAAVDVRAARRADVGAFAVFLAAHTIHFASVALLAAATGGQNIRDAGGYIGTFVVAGAFYAACAAVLRGKLRGAPRWTTAAERRTEIGTTAIVWIVFFQAYALRLRQSLWFTALAVGLAAALAMFAAAAARRRKPQAARVLL